MATNLGSIIATITHETPRRNVPLSLDDENFIQAGCEEEERYGLWGGEEIYDGLLYPICIGDLIHGRYQVVHRLGRGGFSTVWLAHDHKNFKSVALKVMLAGDHDHAGEKEYQMQNMIKNSNTDQSHFLLFEDTFFLRSPHGYHRVLVLPVAGPSLKEDISRYLPIRSRLSAAKHLLEALRSLHQVGLVHSDVNLGNILWDLNPDFIQMMTSNPSNGFYPPTKRRQFKVEWNDEHGNPVYGHQLLPMEFPFESIGNKIYLADFGLVLKAGTSVHYKLQGVQQFVSPDRFHNTDPMPSSDIWSFMVVLLSLYSLKQVFSCQNILSTGSCADYLQDMVNSLGLLPTEWAQEGARMYNASWYASSKESEEASRPKSPFESYLSECRQNLALNEQFFRTRGDETRAEQVRNEIRQREVADKHIFGVINKVFQFRPEDRLTASQLLDDTDWKALMTIFDV